MLLLQHVTLCLGHPARCVTGHTRVNRQEAIVKPLILSQESHHCIWYLHIGQRKTQSHGMLPFLLQRLLNWSFSYCPNPLKGSFFRKPKPRQWPPCSPSERWDQASPSSVSATINGRVLPLVSMLAKKNCETVYLGCFKIALSFLPWFSLHKNIAPGTKTKSSDAHVHRSPQ